MPPLPKHVSLEVTRHCNYHCPYCYCVWHEFPELARRDLPTKTWLRIIDQLIAEGVDDLLFTGGEVLLRRDWELLLRHTRKIAPDCRISLFTNSSRLTDERLKLFRKLRVNLSTSLQGLKTYAEMTGTRRTCFSVLEKIARAKELKCPMSVSMTITRRNMVEAADMFCAAAIAGASSIQIGAMMLEGQGRTRLDLALTHAEWEKVKQTIRELPDCRVSYAFCDEILCACREQPSDLWNQYGLPDASPCPAGRDFAVIGPSGQLRSCLHSVHVLEQFPRK